MTDARGVDPNEMRTNAGETSSLLRVLAHEDRLMLLCQLSQGEYCVGQLEELLALHQPNLSQQLGVLRRKSLVSTRRKGKHIFYRVSDPRVVAVLQSLHGIFCTGGKS